jgi:PAS domain S-box-containing protein
MDSFSRVRSSRFERIASAGVWCDRDSFLERKGPKSPPYLDSVVKTRFCCLARLSSYICLVMSNTKTKAESSFESIFNHVTEGILIANERGEIILCNPKCVQMFGFTDEELKGKKVEALVPKEISEKHIEYRNSYMRNPSKRPMGKNLILRGQRKDGNMFPLEISLSYYQTAEGLFVIAFISDITDRHEQQEKIRRINNELRSLNENLEKKVTERTLVLKEALTELEKSRDELTNALEKEKELNEMKSRFISMASHEFRTPLATILSSTSLISKYIETDQSDKSDKHIARIKNAVTGLTEILNDFLSLGKLEEGKVRANYSQVDVQGVLEEVVSELQAIAKNNQKIELEFAGPNEYYIDKQMFRNILINLIANALKFSGENSLVKVTCLVSENDMQVRVKDQGIGVPEEDQEHLFERFFRGRNAANIQGTGLGLNIVLKYLEMLNGKIDFVSEENVGTTFTLVFPAKYEEE